MGVGNFAEPLVVVTLLFGGAYFNRNINFSLIGRHGPESKRKLLDDDSLTRRPLSLDDVGSDTDVELEGGLALGKQISPWRQRKIGVGAWKITVTSPNTAVFKERFLSRVLNKFPFLVECWYWALIYWVYQVARAIGALTLVESTVDVARRHALQVIHLERHLHIFWEPAIQQMFMKHELLMLWTDRIYSFIHIPGSIFFLVWLFWFTITRHTRNREGQRDSPAGPAVYYERRRAMAMSNLLAFIIFTAYPCMPPRLLSDPDAVAPEAEEARSYGFVDTVHARKGASSVWTTNKFCNQYAAMPSLHFGYSLLIGLTVATIPLAPHHSRGTTISVRGLGRLRLPSARRFICMLVGFAYPFTILCAIVSTANHFILDAVAGACVCAIAWRTNSVLLNLEPLEDYFLWCVRIHKPDVGGFERNPEDD